MNLPRIRDLATKAADEIANQIKANKLRKEPSSANEATTAANSSSTCSSKSRAQLAQSQDQDGQEESLLDQFLCNEEAGSFNDQFEEEDDDDPDDLYEQFDIFTKKRDHYSKNIFSQWDDFN